jgi:hypothetical protein
MQGCLSTRRRSCSVASTELLASRNKHPLLPLSHLGRQTPQTNPLKWTFCLQNAKWPCKLHCFAKKERQLAKFQEKNMKKKKMGV